MFDRLARSWELVRASWGVLQADRELLIFPIVSGIASILVLITFAVPIFLTGLFVQNLDNGFVVNLDNGLGVANYIVLFLFYVVQYTVVIFANTALVGAALIRLKGGDPTVGDGFQIAFGKLGVIVGYATIAATVGLVLRIISDRSEGLGRLAASLIGMAWSLATFLVVPVLVTEDVGPLEAVRRSGRLLRETWGEQIAGNFSIGVIFLLLSLLVVLAAVPGVYFAFTLSNFILLGVVVALAVAALLILSLISSTLSGIYAAAVYQYVTSGETGGYIDAELVAGAFRPK